MLIAGVDEAGRGPVIGPMVIAVAVAEDFREAELKKAGAKDSKVLSPAQREKLFPQIKKMCTEVRIVSISPRELDALMDQVSLNEIEAMKMGQLLNQLSPQPEKIYVDAPDTIEDAFTKRLRKYYKGEAELICRHKADALFPICSAASVIAKVERDRAIERIKEELGVDFGSGYPADSRTYEFLKKEWGPGVEKHIRMKWKTLAKIEEERWQAKLGEWIED